MDKRAITRKLFVIQADILATNKAIDELITELEDDEEKEPSPLPEPT